MSALVEPMDPLVERAWAVAATVVDPELPMLTLADLGVLRAVDVHGERGAERLLVAITPTYSGCPAMATMRDDLVRALHAAGFGEVEVVVQLHPAWTSDDITPAGRVALAEHGISPPGAAPRHDGPTPLRLGPTVRDLRCPRCASPAVLLVSEFGSTACKAQYRCMECAEPFDHIKEI